MTYYRENRAEHHIHKFVVCDNVNPTPDMCDDRHP